MADQIFPTLHRDSLAFIDQVILPSPTEAIQCHRSYLNVLHLHFAKSASARPPRRAQGGSQIAATALFVLTLPVQDGGA
eukprot:2394464-Pyramimonas_sp.AAC.1